MYIETALEHNLDLIVVDSCKISVESPFHRATSNLSSKNLFLVFTQNFSPVAGIRWVAMESFFQKAVW